MANEIRDILPALVGVTRSGALVPVNPLTRQEQTSTALASREAATRELRALPCIEKFQNLAQWTVSAAEPANANVTQATGYSAYGAANLRFVSAAVASKNAFATQDQTINLNGSGGFWLLWNQRYKQTSAQVGLTVYLSHSAALGTGVGRVSFATPLNVQGFGQQCAWVANGDFSTLDGTPNFANDWLSWRFRVDSMATEPHDFELDAVLTKGVRPKILITFDDGFATSYSAGFAEAQKREIPLTHYLIGSLLGTATYVTRAQAVEMAAAGDYIGVHGANVWNSATEATIRADTAALSGLTDGQHGAWPEGNFNAGASCAATIGAAKAAGLRSARAAGGNACFLPGLTEWGALPSYPLNNSLSLVNAKAAVDRAIASGGTAVFYGHKIDSAADTLTWTASDWTALLDYIAQKRHNNLCDVVTIKELYDTAARP